MYLSNLPFSLLEHRDKRLEFLAGKDRPTQGRKGSYAAHSEIELTWLETFVELIAHLVEKFLQAAAEAQVEDIVNEVDPDSSAD